MVRPPTDTQRVLLGLAQQKVRLELGTLDLCFMTLLALKAEQEGGVAFTEQHLFDAYEQVAGALDPGAEGLRARATHAIRRLREQKLLARVDAAGVLRTGEFTLTRLATGIVDFYIADESLTPENLSILTKTLTVSLSQILLDAGSCQDEAAWLGKVAAPLRVTVNDLVRGIEARQRGLDLEQEAFQRDIANLLNADWFGAIDQCQELLETTAKTLRELNDILLRGTYDLSRELDQLLNVVVEGQNPEAHAAVLRVIEQVDRIGSWGNVRQRAFTEYYAYVHRYLRDVVRLDPMRTITQRLRKMLGSREGQSYSLSVAQAAPMRVLREVKPIEVPPPVKRKQKQDAPPLQPEPACEDPERALEAQVLELLAQGENDLSTLVRRLTQDLPEDRRFVAAGRIAKVLAKLRRPLVTRERPWVTIDDNLAIEQWRLPEKHEP